jgi:hypothetical protein
MALYRDSNGVPAGRWAQGDKVVTINAGRWVTFTAPATTLDPGQYWIVLRTDDTEGIIRTRGAAPANWYASIDQFADGPSNRSCPAPPRRARPARPPGHRSPPVPWSVRPAGIPAPPTLSDPHGVAARDRLHQSRRPDQPCPAR